MSRDITRYYARTFYFASQILSPRQRRASYALYAFCRAADSAVDEPLSAEPAREIASLRRLVENPSEGAHRYPWGEAWWDTVQVYQIPLSLFHALLNGVEMDLHQGRYQTFSELYLYSYRVASVVGIMMTYVLGFSDERALFHAEQLGVAMQLTNILRDLGEDRQRGRLYLPLEELLQFGYTEEDWARGVRDERFYRLMAFQVTRARTYYKEGMAGVSLLRTPEARLCVRLMGRLYEAILDKLEKEGYPSFSRRVYLTFPEKISRALPELRRELFYSLREETPPWGYRASIGVAVLSFPAAFSLLTGYFSDWYWMDSLFLSLWGVAALLLLGFSWRGLLVGMLGVGVGGLSEAVGIRTGFPFGEYFYTAVLQPQWAGVPLPIALAWGTLVGLGLLIGSRWGRYRRMAGVVALAVGIDVALEPFATEARGYWVWMDGEVPWMNYIGWAFVAGLVGVMSPSLSPPPGVRRLAFLLIGVLGGLLLLVDVTAGLWVEAGISCVLLVGGFFLLSAGMGNFSPPLLSERQS
ncbi:MAG: carotenoid biosynthesis protein [Bacteroidia bacterium]|nr:carotenoid biosynthesis protein [Bacteroidia bacterium]